MWKQLCWQIEAEERAAELREKRMAEALFAFLICGAALGIASFLVVMGRYFGWI